MKQTKNKVLIGVGCLLAASILCSAASLVLTNTQQLYSVVEADYGVTNDTDGVKDSYVLQLKQPAGVTYSYGNYKLSDYAGDFGSSYLTETDITSVISYTDGDDTWYTLLYSELKTLITFTYELDSTVSGVAFETVKTISSVSQSTKNETFTVATKAETWNKGAGNAIQITATVTKNPTADSEILLNDTPWTEQGLESAPATVTFTNTTLKSGDSLSFYVEIEEAYTYESIAATMGGESVRVYSTKIENSDSTSKTTTYSCSILNVTGDVKVTVNLKGRTYKINLAKEPDEYHFQQVDVTLDSAGTVVAMTPGEELGTSTEVAYGKAFYFVVRAEEGYSAENATVVYDDSLEDVGKIKIGDDDFVVYKVYKLTSDQVSEEGTITVKGVVETQLITVETNEKVEIVSLKNYKTEEELKKKVEEGVTKYTALSGQSYILTFKVPTGYTLSVVNNSSSLTPTQNSDGSYYFKLASINSEQDVSISLEEMRFVFNFEGYGTDNLNSVAVNGSEIGANGYDFEGLESGTYYTFAGWTCASLNLNSVNSIPWAQLNKMSATEYTFKSAWTFNKEKAIEALKGMYETKFSVTRTTGEETDQIVAQVKYDKTLMAELEEEMKAHGDSILATGFINYKCVDGDFVDKVNRIPWARLSTEELPTAADSKLLYLFSFSGSADKAQLKMWSYMSGLYMDRWTVTGVEKDDDRTIYAYTVLQVNGEVIYVYSDGQEANGTATAVENND